MTATLDVAYGELTEFPGYRIGSDGSVDSRWRKHGRKSLLVEEWRTKTQTLSNGYLGVSLRREDGRNRRVQTHILVLRAFHGPRPEHPYGQRIEGRHLDNNKLNNDFRNLCWGTSQQNRDDSRPHRSRPVRDCSAEDAADVALLAQREGQPIRFGEIPGEEGYRVGTDGSIWTRWKLAGARSTRRSILSDEWRLMRPKLLPKTGYLSIEIQGGGRGKRYYLLHSLLLLVFDGPRPPGYVARHWDGDRLNCKWSNLLWGTRQRNHDDMVRHGHRVQGSTHPQSKLDEPSVLAIRSRAAAGERRILLAEEFGRSIVTIDSVVNRTTWRHL